MINYIVRYLLKLRRFFAIIKMKTIIKINKYKGVQIGENCRFTGIPDFGSEPYLIRLGNNVTITSGVEFYTHDGGINVLKHLYNINNINKFGSIIVGDNCFLGANSIILPNVTIGSNSIIGAGSVVTKDIPPNSVYAGNPAKFICSIEEYLKKCTSSSIDFKENISKEKQLKNFFFVESDLKD